MAVRTAANRMRIIAWSRVRNDVGLTNQVCALKTGSGIQKSRRAVRLPFQSTFNKKNALNNEQRLVTSFYGIHLMFMLIND